MGTRRRHGLADALFTPVQQRVLGLLFGQPDRTFQTNELIRLAKSGSGAVQRQLSRLSAAGLLTTTRIGNQKHYKARHDAAIFSELHSLIVKTVGVADPLRQALSRLASEILAAFIYGSVAKGHDKANSDIDLIVISETLGHADIYKAMRPAEQTLARTINVNVMKRLEYKVKRARPDSFVARISSQPRLFLIGSADELE
jgi:predicted nucleotidyltransferase